MKLTYDTGTGYWNDVENTREVRVTTGTGDANIYRKTECEV